MSQPAIWILLTAPGASGIAVRLTAEIGEGTRGIGLRRANMRDASADLDASAQAGAALAAEILYREKYLSRHIVVRYAAAADLFNIHGRSADLAFALALAGAVMNAHAMGGNDVPAIAATGMLDDKGMVQRVEGLPAKLALALAHLPPKSLFLFPEGNESEVSTDIRLRADAQGIALLPVSQLEDALRQLGLAVFRRDADEFRQWQDLAHDAEQWSRGERALIPSGPQLDAARALCNHRAADWATGDEHILAYVRTSLRQRDRRRVLLGLAFGVPGLAMAGFAARAAYTYIDGLHRTRITFDGVSVPGPDYMIAAGPYLRRFGVAIASRLPDNATVLIASNIGLYHGEAADPVSSQHFLTQQSDPPQTPLSYTLRFDRQAREVRLLRAALWASTTSGVTHPAWRATALDSHGREIGAVAEALLGSYHNIPAKWFVLAAPAGRRIAGLRVDSDSRNAKGAPFAGFQAALIQEMQLEY